MNDVRIAELTTQGKTVVFVVIDGKLEGAIALADIIRPESAQAITELKKMGIRVMMITEITKGWQSGSPRKRGLMNTSPRSYRIRSRKR